MPLELPALTVLSSILWRQWLLQNHSSSPGVWLTLAKKGTTSPTTLTYQQALEEALCFGFIDGQTRKQDTATYSQRFAPRTAKSTWSKRNVGIIARLEEESRMHESGRKAVDAAKADGRWDAAYAGSKDAELPEDFLSAVASSPAAQVALEGLSRQNRYVIYMRLAALKTTAGREKRIKAFVEMLERGETPVSQRDGGEKKRKLDEEVEVVSEPDGVEKRTTRSGRKVHGRYG
ncbi:hypothetical protein Slin15195_G055570 [Septoria linicola]|uniref:Uncharacterized protein n=1 Tax=Septoria linicola TaxID=215465 RepID=A0A9Q9AS80_9PEZI|nr:hypothetical protein Slin14017_G071440 [Septoria linicola]USW52238.1 hypothetical protein Slin15195_G055570 [Septoria linicola]